jgi:hypothetical protein
MNPEVDKNLPGSGAAIRGWTLRTYKANKRDIIKDIRSSLSKIHITADLWTRRPIYLSLRLYKPSQY